MAVAGSGLDLDKESAAATIAPQDGVEGQQRLSGKGVMEPSPEIERPQFPEAIIGDAPPPPPYAGEGAVVEDHGYAVGGELNVKLDPEQTGKK